ncbi:MAG: substrate-binding domain-containing protein [Nannocystaceae bacterium]|nr:substrate-binding domain-containing protein [Deltaproteobacteria bacterium]MBP7292415.1 substrate-binding domain-containing protein [Nannocystaceae bacterium]
MTSSDLHRRDAVTRWPMLVAATVLAALALVAWMVLATTAGPQPVFARRGVAPERSHAPDDALVLAGSGSNLPLTRALAAAYAGQGAPPPVVHTSVGSSGGMRALGDGAVDVALVSRPLHPDEREHNAYVPYARVPVYIGVHSSVPDVSLDADALLAVYDGSRVAWKDGSRVIVLQREPGDSSHAAIARRVPRFEEVNERAYQARRWRVIYDDVGMNDALASTEGSIGLLGAGDIPEHLPIRALAYDNVRPTVENIELGAYPFHKDLAFVTRGEPDARAAAFFRFVYSPEGQQIIREFGCMPLGVAAGESSP